MAISYICGFEMASDGEAFATAGNSQYATSNTHSPGRLWTPGNGSALYWLQFQKRPAGGTLAAFCQSCTFWLRIGFNSLPNVDLTPLIVSGAATGFELFINISGTLTIADGNGAGGATSTNALVSNSPWYRIDIDSSGTTRTVYVNGVQWAQSTGRSAAAAQTGFTLGDRTGVSTNLLAYFDDLIIYDGALPAIPAHYDYFVALLIPTAGNSAGSWTDGAGGTGDIHGSVDNIPPVGVAAATAAAKIKNAASGTTLDYVATLQSYTAAGILPDSTITAIQTICNDGEEVATGTKSGGIWCASNPTQSAVAVATGVGFDYGDNGGALGTYPTGWTTHTGIVAESPSVTLSTAPTMTVRKGSSTTRVVDVDFMGMYVVYVRPVLPSHWHPNIERPVDEGRGSVVSYQTF